MKRKYIKTIVIALVVLSFLWILIFNLKPDDKSKNVNTDKINEVLPTDKSDFNLDSNEFELVDESKNLQLFVKPSTAEIAIKDKRGNYTWYSNPQDRDKDTQASGYVKGKLASQISVNYLTKGGQVKEYDSFNDSIKHKQYLIKKSEKGIKVIHPRKHRKRDRVYSKENKC